MTRVAYSMTKTFVAPKEHHDKRTEQMQLGRNTTTICAGLCSLPKSEDGNTARVFVNKKICINNTRTEQITNWFYDNPSPSNTP
jgi:putative intracellular protease/amidase